MLSVFGTIFEFTSAPNTTLSVSASPIVIVPPLNVVVPVTVKLPPTDTSPPIVALPVVVNKTVLTSDHFLDELPNAYVLSVFGNIFEFTSAPNTTLSVSASPIVIVPPLNVVVPVTVKFPPTFTFPVVVKDAIEGVDVASTFVISARNNSLPPTVDPS